MAMNILTLEDLEIFKTEFLEEFKKEMSGFFDSKEKNKAFEHEGKRWLKSHQIQRMLSISAGTLQNLRINGTVPYSKIGGVIFYSYEDIISLMKKNKYNAE